MDNPTAKLLEIMQEQGRKFNPPSILIGKIIAPPPNIRIQINDIILENEDIYIAEYLLKGYWREFSVVGHIVSNTQSASCSKGAPHTHPIDNDNTQTGTITWEDHLYPGDEVAVMPMYGSQQYIVLHRIVRL